MPESRKSFEAEDSDFGAGLGAMDVCSCNEMGAPGASHLGAGDHGPKTDRSRPRSVPVNADRAIHIEAAPRSQHSSRDADFTVLIRLLSFLSVLAGPRTQPGVADD